MANSKDDNKPTIIVKKGGHGGHHGGAWKIAYADFTTAMMCFFLCMWLINTASITTRQAIASYFRRPSIFQEGAGQPLLLGGQGILDDALRPLKTRDPRDKIKIIEDERSYGEMDKDRDKPYKQEGHVEPVKSKGPISKTGFNSKSDTQADPRRDEGTRLMAEKMRQDLEEALNSLAPSARLPGLIAAFTDPDGLSIEIMDTERYSMFDTGSARIKSNAQPAFKAVTDIIKRYPNLLEVYGHTDSTPFPSHTGGYTNWELSADRANTARRLIQSLGYPGERIVSVSGKASSELRKPDAPTDPSNRRITLKLRFQTATNFLSAKQKQEYNDPLKKLLDEEAAREVAALTPAANSTGQPATTEAAAAAAASPAAETVAPTAPVQSTRPTTREQ